MIPILMKKINKIILLSFVLLLSKNIFSQNIQRPKLVVGIVVDQMRWDYLYRYYDRYGEGGFKRILNEGFSCENTFISHLPSFTAVGHSTVYTGSVPAIHGIVGNDWIDQNTGRKWYCTEDTVVQAVGAESDAGRMSPRNLLATTVTDELRIATNFRSKVIGVSLKDRAAILPAGHAANGAFWFDDASGNFITSTWYMKELPGWVKQFNEKREPQKLMSSDWNTLYPMNTYVESTTDAENWEGLFKGEQSSVFPHHLATIYNQDRGSLRSTPYGNTLTLDFARAAIEGNQLGMGAATDFLTINCASTDYVGHKFGPNSVEVEDTYFRLDKDLASFLSYLDKKIGKGNYLLFLTADHGAANAVNFNKKYQIPANILATSNVLKSMNDELAKEFGVDSLVRSATNYHINFNNKKVASANINYDSLKAAVVNFLDRQPGIQFAVDIDHIGDASIPQPVKSMIVNGYDKKRCGPVMIIPEPGWFEGPVRGTTHGNWNTYDTHIPLLFMGWGIKHGDTNRETYMTDIAPTVAALLHIQMPNGAVGKVITEVRK